MRQDNFRHKAREWDRNSNRVQGAIKIANAIQKKYLFHKEMDVIDFGVGTGLLGFEVAPFVKKVYGVDTSLAMLEQVKEKNTPELCLEVIHQDIVQKPLEKEFDALVSSMTLHHVEDLELFFQTIYKNIKKGGFIAIADLEKEDGSFHSSNEGVFHFGFEKEELVTIVEKAGFSNVAFERINVIRKEKDYGIFLLSASR